MLRSFLASLAFLILTFPSLVFAADDLAVLESVVAAGEQVQAATAADVGGEPVEQGLAAAVAGRPQTRQIRHGQAPAAPAAADDAHGSRFFTVHAVSTGSE